MTDMTSIPAPMTSDVQRIERVKDANPEDEAVGDSEIEESPKHIDGGRGQALARRLCEWALEGAAGDAVADMGQAVGEERPAEEIRQVLIPVHRFLLQSAKANAHLNSSMVSLKLVEEQKQILRLATPELKSVRGPVRSE